MISIPLPEPHLSHAFITWPYHGRGVRLEMIGSERGDRPIWNVDTKAGECEERYFYHVQAEVLLNHRREGIVQDKRRHSEASGECRQTELVGTL